MLVCWLFLTARTSLAMPATSGIDAVFFFLFALAFRSLPRTV